MRNTVPVWYATLLSEADGKDAEGYDTLEPEQTWSAPKAARWSVTGGAGERVIQAFGGDPGFTRVLSITGECPLKAGDRVWLGISPTERHNYEVVRVTDGLWDRLAGLREVLG